jgi:hypothetical protein
MESIQEHPIKDLMVVFSSHQFPPSQATDAFIPTRLVIKEDLKTIILPGLMFMTTLSGIGITFTSNLKRMMAISTSLSIPTLMNKSLRSLIAWINLRSCIICCTLTMYIPHTSTTTIMIMTLYMF